MPCVFCSSLGRRFAVCPQRPSHDQLWREGNPYILKDGLTSAQFLASSSSTSHSSSSSSSLTQASSLSANPDVMTSPNTNKRKTNRDVRRPPDTPRSLHRPLSHHLFVAHVAPAVVARFLHPSRLLCQCPPRQSLVVELIRCTSF